MEEVTKQMERDLIFFRVHREFNYGDFCYNQLIRLRNEIGFWWFWEEISTDKQGRRSVVVAVEVGRGDGYLELKTAPMIYNGINHLFYQWSTKGAVWGDVVWAHTTSTELVNWIHHKYAIVPSEPFDIEGVWSGSATFVQGKPIIQYTGIIKSSQWNYQVQDMAVPKNLSDPYLVEWVKPVQYNPVIKPTGIINGSAFRDPTTGCQAEHALHWAKDTGMWECPDFFPVSVDGKEGLDTSVLGPNVKHVFKVSLDDTKHDYYTIGTYNPEKDKYTPDEGSIDNDSGLRYDYGKFYASKTFFDSEKNRRVLWDWVNESSSVADDIKKGWAGLQAVPRTVWLAENCKQLKQWPVKEIQQLRTKRVSLQSHVLKRHSILEVPGLTASQADADVKFKLPKLKDAEIMDPSWVNPQLLCSSKPASVQGKSGPFGLLALASKNLEEQTAIFFKFVWPSEQVSFVSHFNVHFRLTLNSYSMRLNIDHSIVESYGVHGKAVITARVYPTLAIDSQAHLYVFNNGTEYVEMSSLKAWSMKKAEIKYLKDLKHSDI
ncbi:hypothetical protein C5167_044514 [Papaver somniferum]|uniref:Glycosyl hydrolase family 32 C-terminal domain-containing protein n=1 Tax=Papaver somniferum TaxID=3469 RepID=A0A4Y7LCN5_PAPSO|nr:hypothetical protein C5167_044514 [Papaver somniferum]